MYSISLLTRMNTSDTKHTFVNILTAVYYHI